jgi:RNA polymerase sigma-70 factor (ECF subfamily)
MLGEATVVASNQDAAADRLGTLFDAHHQRLYRLARRMSRSADEARDLVQDAFLRAARAPGSVPWGASAEEAWLVRVLVNLCRDRWRQTATRERLLLRQGYGGQVDRAAPMPVERGPDQEAAVIARSIVWRGLATLDPRRRAVLVMHELEGTPVEVIARTLGVTAITVRWHLSKGRRQLAEAVRGLEGAKVRGCEGAKVRGCEGAKGSTP